jgi:hypothetical protein
LATEAAALDEALAALISATQAAVAAPNANLGLANATLYLNATGHVIVAWLWLRQAMIAQKALSGGAALGDDEGFYRGKLGACRYFFRYELPKIHTEFALVKSLDDTCLAFDPADFGAV